MNPEVKELIVPLVAIRSTVVDKLLLIVVTEMELALISSAIILDVLMFTGLNVVVVNETILAFVADKLVQEILSADTEVVVNVKLLQGGQPAIEV
jgi:hypothetical protein